MATFLDIIAQLKFDVQGNEDLGDISTELDKAEKEAGRLETKIKALGTAINQTNEASKRNFLANELKKSEQELKRLKDRFKDTSSERAAAKAAREAAQATREQAKAAREVERATAKAAREQRKLAREAQKAAQEAQKPFDDLKDGILQVFGGTLLAGGVQGLVQGVFNLGKAAIQTSIEMQALRTSLAAATGSTEAGAASFEFIKNLSREFGLNIQGTANAFKNFAASAAGAGFQLDEIQNIFKQVAVSTTALNLSADDTNGIFLATSQILSKGKVSAEELRGQIGERLAGAFELAAKSMGQNTAELSKNLELGNVYAVDFIPKFAKALKDKYEGSVDAAANTTARQLEKLRTEWTLLFTEIGEQSDGFINRIVSGAVLAVRSITQLLDSLQNEGKIVETLEKFGGKTKATSGLLGFLGITKTADDLVYIKTILGYADETIIAQETLKGKIEAVAKATQALTQSADFQSKSGETQAVILELLQEKLQGVTNNFTAGTKATITNTKAAETYANKLRDVTDAINDAITRQREYIEQAKAADGKESEATIRARIAAQQEKELNALEKLRREAAQKLGKNDPTVTALLKTLSGVIKDRFSLEAENEVNKFLEKQKELITKFNNEIKDLQAKAEIDRRKLLSGTSAEADIAILEAEFAQRKQAREKEQAERVKDATELNQDVKQVNDLYREQELIAEAEFAAAKNDINEKYLKKAIDDLANFSDIRISETDQAESEALTALNNAYTKGLIDKTQYEAQKTAIQKEFQKQRINAQKAEIEIQILALETTSDQTDEVKRKIAALKADLAKLNQELSEPADDTAKQRREKLVSETIDYAGQSLEIIKSINALIIANETEKYDKLISLQQERVERANRIADEGNAEALQREEARLQQLTEARERAAARQRRIAAVLNAANIALAATESIVAITKSAAQGGVAAPVTVPITLAAIAAGIGIITSLIGGFSNQTAQGFEEGTPFVKGKKERSTAKDNIPAWLTEGERVVTVNNNRKYYDIYEYIEKNKPNPELLKQRLAGNVVIDYNALQSQHINAKGYELQAAVKSVISEQLSNALTAINGNMELLVNETHKARKSGTDINNVAALAKAVAAELQRENLRWKL